MSEKREQQTKKVAGLRAKKKQMSKQKNREIGRSVREKPRRSAVGFRKEVGRT